MKRSIPVSMPWEPTFSVCKHKGAFITLDGIDGAGKTTQCDRLVKWLEKNNRPVLKTHEPGGSQIGSAIREIILGDCHSISPLSETLLLFADRYEHQRDVIIPALKKGITVISDRGHDSTVAYQAYGKGVSKEFILEFGKTHLVQPHLTFLLKLDSNTGKTRIQRRADGIEKGEVNKFDGYDDAFFNRVAEGYEFIGRTFPQRIRHIDADRSPDVIFHDIQTQTDAFFRHYRV